MIRNVISVLFLSISSLYAQSDLQCDSVKAHFDNLNETAIGLVQYEKAPVLIGGHEQLYIASTAVSKIFVWLAIDKQGKPQCAHIVRSDNERLNDEAIKLVEGLRFTPAEQRGKPIISVMVLPVAFGEKKQADKKNKKTSSKECTLKLAIDKARMQVRKKGLKLEQYNVSYAKHEKAYLIVFNLIEITDGGGAEIIISKDNCEIINEKYYQ